MERLPLKGLESANKLLKENMDAIDEFIKNDPKGKKLLAYYTKLDAPFAEVCVELRETIGSLREKTEVIAAVVAAQQSYAGMGGLTEDADLAEIMEHALTIQSSSNERHNITVERKYHELPKIKIQKIKLINTLVNLIKNAKDAMAGLPADQKRLKVVIKRADDKALISVSDTGCGISRENLKLIFSHGFTTKKDGHGFGLHSSANYLKEMGGELWAESEGEGKGATFIIRIPIDLSPAMQDDGTKTVPVT
jgi:C4-dicarboxylate-specific signal transduction histidine kinase